MGPRPALPGEVARYTQAQRARLAVKPGTTGPRQVGGRSEVDFDGQLRLDIDYVRRQSLWGDMVLLLRTVPAVLGGRGAY